MSKKKRKQLVKLLKMNVHRLEQFDDRLIQMGVDNLQNEEQREKLYQKRHFRSNLLKVIIICLLLFLSYIFKQDLSILMKFFQLM